MDPESTSSCQGWRSPSPVISENRGPQMTRGSCRNRRGQAIMAAVARHRAGEPARVTTVAPRGLASPTGSECQWACSFDDQPPYIPASEVPASASGNAARGRETARRGRDDHARDSLRSTTDDRLLRWLCSEARYSAEAEEELRVAEANIAAQTGWRVRGLVPETDDRPLRRPRTVPRCWYTSESRPGH